MNLISLFIVSILTENIVLTAKWEEEKDPIEEIIPDPEEEIGDIARFASTLDGVTELHLLPYHRLGEVKYEGLSRSYLMGDEPLIANEKIERLKGIVEATGLKCQIGG